MIGTFNNVYLSNLCLFVKFLSNQKFCYYLLRKASLIALYINYTLYKGRYT